MRDKLRILTGVRPRSIRPRLRDPGGAPAWEASSRSAARRCASTRRRSCWSARGTSAS